VTTHGSRRAFALALAYQGYKHTKHIHTRKLPSPDSCAVPFFLFFFTKPYGMSSAINCTRFVDARALPVIGRPSLRALLHPYVNFLELSFEPARLFEPDFIFSMAFVIAFCTFRLMFQVRTTDSCMEGLGCSCWDLKFQSYSTFNRTWWYALLISKQLSLGEARRHDLPNVGHRAFAKNGPSRTNNGISDTLNICGSFISIDLRSCL
jgi:hypothetical protein